MYLVLLETSGNQSYIFATNKLRENLGASELTRNAGERWVVDAVQAVTGQPLPGLSQDPAIIHTTEQHRIALLQQPSIFEAPATGQSPLAAEIILAASGKALILVREHSTARDIVKTLTTKALKDSPGLDLCGAILPIEPETFSSANIATNADFAIAFNQLLRHIHERHAYIHAKGPGNATRFLRLPIIANCKTSGLPATTLHPEPDGNSHQPRSAVSLAKDNKTVRATTQKRLGELLKHSNIKDKGWQFPLNASELEQHLGVDDTENSWLAVVHADGNGLGQIFLNFATHLATLATQANADSEKTLTLQAAFSQLRQFSIELDRCTENAFRRALLETFEDYAFPNPARRCLPIVPLILGGDDLTVLCDGRKALTFTASFLKAFEDETQASDLVSEIANAALKKGNLSACAGIAIVKPHFPFSIAYQLAESLIASAKEVKQKLQHNTATPTQPDPYPSSALDFHILYDSSNVNLSDIRKKLTLSDTSRIAQLTNKPYVVSPIETPTGISTDDQNWLSQHKWSDFIQAVKEVKTFQTQQRTPPTDSAKSSLPRTQAYGLRQTLFQGIGPTDAYLKMLTTRYTLTPNTSHLLHGTPEAPTLFQLATPHPTDPPPADPEAPKKDTYLTNYLDALDAAPFL